MESSSSDSDDEYYSFDEASDEEQNAESGEYKEEQTPNASSSSYKKEVSSTSEGKMEAKSNSTPLNPDEVEFVVKNLDTGESFSSKEIDKKIPKPKFKDPIAANIRKRDKKDSSSNSKSSKKKKGALFFSKVMDKSKKLKDQVKRAKVKPAQQERKLFAQIIKQGFRQSEKSSPIWVMKFNYDGVLLASGSKDGILNVWKVTEATGEENTATFLEPIPFRSYSHSADVLCITWTNSRSNLILSSSMDKTVKCWDTKNNTKECRTVFELEDVVTTVEFHPKNEELFITGSLDFRIRIWNLVEKKIVTEIVQGSGFITSAAIDLEGDFVVIGYYEGHVSVHYMKDLKCKQVKQLQKSRKGRKVTGIQMVPGTKYALITSNDSHIRLFNWSDCSIVRKYRGHINNNFQIVATQSEKGTYIISGSEDFQVYLWETSDVRLSVLGSKTRVLDKFQAHSSTVTVALFAPFSRRKTTHNEGDIIVTADATGEIRVFENVQLLH